jgi:hypothetical protein
MYDEKELLLVREASMASMAIGIGLTHIRKFDFTQPGFFYSGMFSFTTGLERLMKLIIICDFRVKNNDAFPNNQQLKAFGHKITELFNHSRKIKNDYDFEIDDKRFIDDDFYETIVQFLSDFATTARYYNLDALSGYKQNSDEPYRRWNNDISETIVQRHYRKNPKNFKKKMELAKKMMGNTIVFMNDENGNEIRNLNDFYTKGDQVTTKQKYSMFYLYEINRFLCDLLCELHHEGNLFPYLPDFFAVFRHNDKSHIIKIKSWNPNPPYRF